MKFSCFLLLTHLLLLSNVVAAVEPLRLLEAKPMPELEKAFLQKSGWIGADGDYSVQVSKDRTLWFFSDTWIGEIVDGKRTKATLINNSVGIQTKNKEAVDYYWKTNKAGKPTAAIAPADGRGWFWPIGGAMVGEQLHLFLWQMEKADGPAAFGFRTVAVWHALIENPLDEPAKWKIAQKKIPFTELAEKRHRLFGSAVMTEGKFTYIYGTEDHPKEYLHQKSMILARVETEQIGNFDKWLFHMENGWTSHFEDLVPMTKGLASEYSVTAMPDLRGYVAVCNDSFLSPKIVGRYAYHPEGPWSDPVVLYTCPEPAWDKEIFAYAGKAHASLSSKNELIITYAANARQLSQVLKDTRLYWPKFVGVKVSRREMTTDK